MRAIDLRSDTFTLPSRKMLETILDAPLGDDVEKEDETVNRLQSMAAKMFGAEDALLVPSGCQGNLVSMMVHCRRGDEIVLESDAHMYYYEIGGMSALVGAIPRLITGRRGVFTAEQVEAAIRPTDVLHYPPTRLLEIENTHNRAGGCCWTSKQVGAVAKVARDHDMKVHMDGARIFNASIATGTSVKQYKKHVDSISFCLSKGLGCPIGSLLVGSHEFIDQARIYRKMVGGGMRQAGIIAAPGIYALQNMISRLQEDHDNALVLAKGLEKLEGITVDMASVQTNIVIADVSGTGMTSDEFVAKCKDNGVLIFSFGPTTVRFVTRYGITKADVEELLGRLERMLR